MFDNLQEEMTKEAEKLEAVLEGDFVHVKTVVHNLLVKLNLAVDTNAENGKAYIKALAENGIYDLTHKPPVAPASTAPATDVPAGTVIDAPAPDDLAQMP